MHKSWLIFSQTVTVCVAVLFTVSVLKPEWVRRGPHQIDVVSVLTHNNPPDSAPKVPGTHTSLSAAAKRASAAVASITASKMPVRNPATEDPWFQFFFGNGAQNQEPQVGLGSAVVVSPQGYLLTNNHVIDGADDIEVQLNDGRKARAKLIGTDPESDLAVLKIDLDKLPVMTFGQTEHI
ncbi:MAG: trypsin-like peptidase domain-containing protein, partial [Burkholderiales bacterium]